jgi:ElaB/YqjD/DUF883 family membrane-anchored ribosome-binding protein
MDVGVRLAKECEPKISSGVAGGYSARKSGRSIAQLHEARRAYGMWYARHCVPPSRAVRADRCEPAIFTSAERMMTTPEMNTPNSAGYGAGMPQGNTDGMTGNGPSAPSGPTDDVSFARNLGVDQTSDAADKVKHVAQRGVESAEDAMSQLQAKASELTSNLINKVNVDELTAKLEEQVREHPARTLMFAAGAGFLLGRAARK